MDKPVKTAPNVYDMNSESPPTSLKDRLKHYKGLKEATKNQEFVPPERDQEEKDGVGATKDNSAGEEAINDVKDEEEGFETGQPQRVDDGKNTKKTYFVFFSFCVVAIGGLVAVILLLVLNDRTVPPTTQPVSPNSSYRPTIAPTPSSTIAPVTLEPTATTSVPSLMPVTFSPTTMPSSTTAPVTLEPTATTPAPSPLPVTLPPSSMPITLAPTKMPTNTPTSSFDAVKAQLSAISGEEVFDDINSPQFFALDFLVNGENYLSSISTLRELNERYAAITFYFATEGDKWDSCFREDTNCIGPWLVGNVCNWQFIICNQEGFVTSVNFEAGNNLGGSLPMEIVAFQSLEELILKGNSLTGMIPSLVGQINTLEQLDLSNNSLTGSIPEGLYSLTGLLNLYLNNNIDLNGRLSAAIGELNSLVEFRISDTSLGGLIPDEMYSLANIEEIDLSGAQFKGPLSSSFESLSASINRLYLDNNAFAGTVPTSFGNLSNLSELTLHENNLTGSISASICDLRGKKDDELQVLTVDCNEVECDCCSTCF